MVDRTQNYQRALVVTTIRLTSWKNHHGDRLGIEVLLLISLRFRALVAVHLTATIGRLQYRASSTKLRRLNRFDTNFMQMKISDVKFWLARSARYRLNHR
jgi:hypothetical protein